MFILLNTFMLSVVLACTVKNQYLQNLYPTQQEVYQLDMSELFDGDNLYYICLINNGNQEQSRFKDFNRCSSTNDGIDVENVLTEIKYSQNNLDKMKIYKSISGQQNYISAISSSLLLITYKVDYNSNSIEQQMSQQIPVTCISSLSSIFTQQFTKVITDCYTNQSFQLLLFDQNSQDQPIIIYQFNQQQIQLPSKTKLVYTNNSIIYAQYYQNNQSYLSTYFYNENNQTATLQSQFRISTFTDFQLMINQKQVAILNLTNCFFISSIQNLNNYYLLFIPNIDDIQLLAFVTVPTFIYGQQLNLFFIVNDDHYQNIIEYQFNGSHLNLIHSFDSSNIYTYDQNNGIQIFVSQNFLVVQQNDVQTFFFDPKQSQSRLIQNMDPIYQAKRFEESIQLYLDYQQDKLLEFSRLINWYHLVKPKLIINISTQSQNGNIIISAFENPDVVDDIQIIGCNKSLSFQLLSQNNNSILYASQQSRLSAVQDLKQIFRLNDHYSGPLLQLNITYDLDVNSNISISNPQSEVFQYLNTNLEGVFQNQTQIYFVQDHQLLFYAWTSTQETNLIFYTICQLGSSDLNCQSLLNISCNSYMVTNILMSQYSSTELLLVFDQGDQNVLVYSIEFIVKIEEQIQQISLYQAKLFFNYTVSNQQTTIQQYQILYNKLIVLDNQKEITVNLLNSSTSYQITQQTINLIEENQFDIQFTPIQISINQQIFQNYLFINNINSFIVLQLLDQPLDNNNFIILSQQQVNQDIYQIIIIQVYVVVACITDAEQNMLSFSVYDIDDITTPNFLKPLPNCTIYPGAQIISNNFFFYVRQIYSNLLVYSLDLPYHSSLYYNLSLNEEYNISCTNTYEFSILSFKNFLYASFQNNPYSFQVAQTKQQYKMFSNVSLTLDIFNPWKILSDKYELIVVNIYLQISMNQTQFDHLNTLTFYAKKSSKNKIMKSLNMASVSMGQVLNYTLLAFDNNGSPIDNPNFNITNQFINEQQYFTNYIVNVSQMVSFCGSLFYQNTSGLFQSSYVIFDGLQITNYNQLNFNLTECLSISASINNLSVYMNSICRSTSSLYVFSFFPSTNDLINNFSQICNYSQPINFSYKTFQIENPPFDSIKKSSQLSYYLFVLGQNGQNAKTRQLYIYNLNVTQNQQKTQNPQIISKYVRKIYCKGGISDYNYTILQNKSLINSTYSGRGVIFYLCQNPSQLKYVNFNITNTTQLSFNYISYPVSDLITKYISSTEAIFSQLFIYLVKFDQIIIVLTSKYSYNLIIILSYSPLSYSQASLQFEDVIAYIPPYGTYSQVPIGVLQDSYLGLMFQQVHAQGIDSIIAIYNIETIRQTYNLSNGFNYSSTIQMNGGYYFNQSLSNILQIALIRQSTSNDSGFYMLVLSKDSAFKNQTQISTLVFNQQIYFNCSDVSQLQNDYSYHLEASNSFNQSKIQLKLIIHDPSNPVWAWILLVLTIIICAASVSWFWKKIKTPNLEERKQSDYQEIEM